MEAGDVEAAARGEQTSGEGVRMLSRTERGDCEMTSGTREIAAAEGVSLLPAIRVYDGEAACVVPCGPRGTGPSPNRPPISWMRVMSPLWRRPAIRCRSWNHA